MSKVLIFGGTTEGRALAEFCVKNCISADVSSATDYGADLLPAAVGILRGRLDADGIQMLLQRNQYSLVIDATHPYAIEATQNIRQACSAQNTAYYRLLRDSSPVYGESVSGLNDLVTLLNRTDDTILSTLGSKSVSALTAVSDYADRIWLRLLPSDTVLDTCTSLGYDPDKIILANGPFRTDENIAHIRQSHADILLSKESGAIGGYPEKAAAAKFCGIRMITLCRPQETGYTYDEITLTLIQKKKDNLL